MLWKKEVILYDIEERLDFFSYLVENVPIYVKH